MTEDCNCHLIVAETVMPFKIHEYKSFDLPDEDYLCRSYMRLTGCGNEEAKLYTSDIKPLLRRYKDAYNISKVWECCIKKAIFEDKQQKKDRIQFQKYIQKRYKTCMLCVVEAYIVFAIYYYLLQKNVYIMYIEDTFEDEAYTQTDNSYDATYVFEELK